MTPTRPRQAPARSRERDSGAITLWAAVTALALLSLTALVIDGGNHIRAKERAESIAAEAARAAGQSIDIGQVIANGTTVVDEDSARQAALDYIAAAHATGTVAFTPDRQTIIVTVTVTYQPVFTELLGLDPQATGTAQATLIRNGTAP